MMDWWLRAKAQTPPTLRKALQSITLLVPWMIWKQRNECVFDNARPLIDALVDRIKDWPNVGQKLGRTGAAGCLARILGCP
uniref:Uncharacterized protein n=1 Tax=Aegilops tauschii subsp. strangulata TaxID=200361 RepID=A0A453L310_AEGTS